MVLRRENRAINVNIRQITAVQLKKFFLQVIHKVLGSNRSVKVLFSDGVSYASVHFKCSFTTECQQYLFSDLMQKFINARFNELLAAKNTLPLSPTQTLTLAQAMKEARKKHLMSCTNCPELMTRIQELEEENVCLKHIKDDRIRRTTWLLPKFGWSLSPRSPPRGLIYSIFPWFKCDFRSLMDFYFNFRW